MWNVDVINSWLDSQPVCSRLHMLTLNFVAFVENCREDGSLSERIHQMLHEKVQVQRILILLRNT